MPSTVDVAVASSGSSVIKLSAVVKSSAASAALVFVAMSIFTASVAASVVALVVASVRASVVKSMASTPVKVCMSNQCRSWIRWNER